MLLQKDIPPLCNRRTQQKWMLVNFLPFNVRFFVVPTYPKIGHHLCKFLYLLTHPFSILQMPSKKWCNFFEKALTSLAGFPNNFWQQPMRDEISLLSTCNLKFQVFWEGHKNLSYWVNVKTSWRFFQNLWLSHNILKL